MRNIIQQFENSTETGEEVSDGADPQRLSSSSLGDEMDRYLRLQYKFTASWQQLSEADFALLFLLEVVKLI